MIPRNKTDYSTNPNLINVKKYSTELDIARIEAKKRREITLEILWHREKIRKYDLIQSKFQYTRAELLNKNHNYFKEPIGVLNRYRDDLVKFRSTLDLNVDRLTS